VRRARAVVGVVVTAPPPPPLGARWRWFFYVYTSCVLMAYLCARTRRTHTHAHGHAHTRTHTHTPFSTSPLRELASHGRTISPIPCHLTESPPHRLHTSLNAGLHRISHCSKHPSTVPSIAPSRLRIDRLDALAPVATDARRHLATRRARVARRTRRRSNEREANAASRAIAVATLGRTRRDAHRGRSVERSLGRVSTRLVRGRPPCRARRRRRADEG